jgi:hypothetical protein
MANTPPDTPTWVTEHPHRAINIRKCRVTVSAGPDAGKQLEFAQTEVVIGRSGGQLVLADPKVSALHAELRVTDEGYCVRDLDSSNGTYIDGVRIRDGYIAPGSTITVGSSAILFETLAEAVTVPLWAEPRLGSLVGGSTAMRRLYYLIDLFASKDTTVLILARLGPARAVAEAIHECSPRRSGPFCPGLWLDSKSSQRTNCSGTSRRIHRSARPFEVASAERCSTRSASCHSRCSRSCRRRASSATW